MGGTNQKTDVYNIDHVMTNAQFSFTLYQDESRHYDFLIPFPDYFTGKELGLFQKIRVDQVTKLLEYGEVSNNLIKFKMASSTYVTDGCYYTLYRVEHTPRITLCTKNSSSYFNERSIKFENNNLTWFIMFGGKAKYIDDPWMNYCSNIKILDDLMTSGNYLLTEVIFWLELITYVRFYYSPDLEIPKRKLLVLLTILSVGSKFATTIEQVSNFLSAVLDCKFSLPFCVSVWESIRPNKAHNLIRF